MTTKLCINCKEVKELGLFGKHKGRPDGLNSWCKPCYAAYKRVYYENNKDAVLKTNAKSRSKRGAEVIKAEKRAYYEKVRVTDEYLAKLRKYTEDNKDKKREYDRAYRDRRERELREKKAAWRLKNADLVRVIRASYKARRRAIELDGDSTAMIRAWLSEQELICRWCRVDCSSAFHIDHMNPLSRGGKHVVANLCIACPRCNIKKNARPLHEWEQEIQRTRCDVAMLDAA